MKINAEIIIIRTKKKAPLCRRSLENCVGRMLRQLDIELVTLEMNGKGQPWTYNIDIRHHFIREAISDKNVKLFYVPTNETVADNDKKSLLH